MTQMTQSAPAARISAGELGLGAVAFAAMPLLIAGCVRLIEAVRVEHLSSVAALVLAVGSALALVQSSRRWLRVVGLGSVIGIAATVAFAAAAMA